jgi:8-oxo-dGTP diphosphatase
MILPFRPILGTLGYVFSPCREKVLLIHRNTRPEDQHLGKYNGLGGKVEAQEDVVSGMCREIFEESGLVCQSMSLAGTISWPGFGKQGEDWFGFIFRILSFEGTLKESSPEGSLAWISIDRVMDLPLWEGDRHFLPLVLDTNGEVFHAVLPYKDGRPVSWNVSKCGAPSVFSAPIHFDKKAQLVL